MTLPYPFNRLPMKDILLEVLPFPMMGTFRAIMEIETIGLSSWTLMAIWSGRRPWEAWKVTWRHL
jgi:hypothetical protein